MNAAKHNIELGLMTEDENRPATTFFWGRLMRDRHRADKIEIAVFGFGETTKAGRHKCSHMAVRRINASLGD